MKGAKFQEVPANDSTNSLHMPNPPARARAPVSAPSPQALRRRSDPPIGRLSPALREQTVALVALPMRPVLRRSPVAIALYLKHMIPAIQDAIRKGYSLHEIYDILHAASPMPIGERQFRKYMQRMLRDAECIVCGQKTSVLSSQDLEHE